MTETGHGKAPDEADGRDVVRVEWSDVEDPALDVIESVATATGQDPTDLPPLHGRIDGDALGTLVDGSGDVEMVVSFSYANTDVVVAAGEFIEVRPRAE